MKFLKLNFKLIFDLLGNFGKEDRIAMMQSFIDAEEYEQSIKNKK